VERAVHGSNTVAYHKDALIVGGGSAGGMAAIRAKEVADLAVTILERTCAVAVPSPWAWMQNVVVIPRWLRGRL
jgi:succinate dehydrogenase/fumarate reductase flavoprotein subunit